MKKNEYYLKCDIIYQWYGFNNMHNTLKKNANTNLYNDKGEELL